MNAPSFDVASVRQRFPALRHGAPDAYLDGPGGTQVPASVIAAMGDALAEGVSNIGGGFDRSLRAGEITADARRAVADLFDAEADGVVFGQNMTSLTFAFSRALSRQWVPGDEVVVTRLDHDANVTPWRVAVADRGVRVRTVDFDRTTGVFTPEDVAELVGPRTRLVAFTAASNALGTVPAAGEVARVARQVGATVVVDAVHHSAHRRISPAAIGADVVLASAYKFFGPHTGLMVARPELLETVQPYRLDPAPSSGPGKWETGTQSFESLAGVTAAVEYLASLGAGSTRRERLEGAFAEIRAHEEELAVRFLRGIASMPSIRLHGPADPASVGDRVSTFALEVAGHRPADVAARMAAAGIYVWSGDYYAVGVMQHLGTAATGGLVRIGFVHYNTAAEVDRALEVLDSL